MPGDLSTSARGALDVSSGFASRFPQLLKSGHGYDRDVVDALAKCFQRTIDPAGLEEALAPLRNGSVLVSAHSVVARQNLSLSAQHFESALTAAELPPFILEHGELVKEILDGKRTLVEMGMRLGVEYFDSEVSLDEMERRLESEVALVPLDWRRIVGRDGFRHRIEGTPDEHLLCLVPTNGLPRLAPIVPVVGVLDSHFLVRGYQPTLIGVPRGLFEDARHSERSQHTTVFIFSSQAMPKIELENELPQLFRHGPYLEAVFDGGNAHVSDRAATTFVVHRDQIDALKRGIEEKDFDAIEKALTNFPDGLHSVIQSMYIPGLFEKKYQEFMGAEAYRDLCRELEPLQRVLKSFVWRRLREDNPAQEATDLEQLRKFAVAVEYMAERIERAIPPIVLERYVSDTRQQLQGFLRNDPTSQFAATWNKWLVEIDRAEDRIRSRASGAGTEQPPQPDIGTLMLSGGG